jgi:fatty-acyl-CoA synthase
MTTSDPTLLWPQFRDAADVPVIEAVPLAERGLPASTYAMLRRAAEAWPHDPAVTVLPSIDRWQDPVSLTFAELHARVCRVANLLTRLGVTRTDAVGILAPNTSSTIVSLLAAEAAGIAAPVNPGLGSDKITALLAASGARVLITAGPELDPSAPQRLADLGASSAVRTVLLLRPDATAGPAPELPRIHGLQVHWLDDAAADEPADRLVASPPTAEDLAAYFHTGGTTGTPKLAAHTHANQVVTAWMMAAYEDEDEDDDAGATLAALPLFHVNAVLVTTLMPLLKGRHVVWVTPLGYREPGLYGVFWRLVERYRIQAMSAVPTVYAALSQVPVDADISSLRLPAVGAAPLPDAVREAFAERTGVELLEGYGLTEGTCVTAMSRPGMARPRSVGMRLPYQQVKAVHEDERTGQWQDLPPGIPGRLVVSGPNVFAGYLRDGVPSTEGVVRDGWLDTGDHGLVDEDGFIRLTGRLKDLIIRGGHNIDPAVIEEGLLAHPAVAAAAAVGRPDRHAGEVPVAYVTLSPGATATEDELRQWAATHVPEAAAAPKQVHVVDAIPLTDVGKVFKPRLRADTARRLVADELVSAGIPTRAVLDSDGATVAVLAAEDDPLAERIRDLLGGYTFAWRFAGPDGGHAVG